MEKELDFLNEASNAERCFKELKHLNYIYVPKIYYDKSTKVFISFIQSFFKTIAIEIVFTTESFNNGIYRRRENQRCRRYQTTWTRFKRCIKNDVIKQKFKTIKLLLIYYVKKVDKKLVNAFAQQVFHSGFVHADPHHANVFVRKLNNSNEAEIVLLDHGLYEYINEDDRRNLCKLWKSIILKNEEMMKFYTTKLNVKGMYKISLALSVS